MKWCIHNHKHFLSSWCRCPAALYLDFLHLLFIVDVHLLQRVLQLLIALQQGFPQLSCQVQIWDKKRVQYQGICNKTNPGYHSYPFISMGKLRTTIFTVLCMWDSTCISFIFFTELCSFSAPCVYELSQHNTDSHYITVQIKPMDFVCSDVLCRSCYVLAECVSLLWLELVDCSVCRNLRKSETRSEKILLLIQPEGGDFYLILCFLMNMSQNDVNQDTTTEIKDEEKESGISSR